MADKETEFNIVVGAEADVNSAKKAAKDIGKAVESSVKGGHIEVPVDITIPIDKSKDKLTRAQKDITATISKMMTKGFSASGKDIDTLTSKFNTFVKAFDQAGKGRRNNIFREIRKQVEDLQKSYAKSQKRYPQSAIDKASAKWTKEMRDREKAKLNKKEDAKFTAELRKGAGRGKASTPGSATNLGIRSPNMDTTFLDKKNLQTNDRLGTYYGKNSLMKQAMETERLNQKQRVTVTKVGIEEANRMAEEALARGGNHHRLTPAEKAKGMSSALLPELSQILGDIQKR